MTQEHIYDEILSRLEGTDKYLFKQAMELEQPLTVIERLNILRKVYDQAKRAQSSKSL